MDQAGYLETIKLAAKAAGMDSALSRRGFLVLSACAVYSLSRLGLGQAYGADAAMVIVDNAKGLILADPSRCVGCQRCELACTEFNDGQAHIAQARIKIDRALNFGPEGPSGGSAMRGLWGDGLVWQSTCRQCPHPVPCEMACANDAIQADPKTGARFVDEAACVGCRMCQRACPWNMINFDEQRQKASKCFLCHGQPKCVEACPSGALSLVPWRDLTREGRPGGPAMCTPAPDKMQTCVECHAPAQKAPANR